MWSLSSAYCDIFLFYNMLIFKNNYFVWMFWFAPLFENIS
jgi:hypothetical protein